jgi:hypothetical protein
MPPGPQKALPTKVVNDLSTFKGQRYQFGSNVFQLDRKGLKHILERHHLQYLAGETKASQSFFNGGQGIQEIQDLVGQVMQQNREILANMKVNSMKQVTGTVGGVTYVLGLNKGRVGQFYSK